jgi:hypothetical protein
MKNVKESVAENKNELEENQNKKQLLSLTSEITPSAVWQLSYLVNFSLKI